jgi:hypothetical protein
MRDRGYPVEDFGERAELLAADHPQVVEHYRAAPPRAVARGSVCSTTSLACARSGNASRHLC